MRFFVALSLGFLATVCSAQAPRPTPGNRLAYLDELDPYYPHAKFPKLITPQWIGEDGVEAAVILAIDDMREPAKYEAFLRPILRRLQKIDGRAPVSIMTCKVDPKDPQLQTWLKEGLSLECHTIDHPCPFFKQGFEKAKSTYDRCVDLMNEIPGNKPVAFRMPCCDSLNTPSPRFWAEIFNKVTPLSPLGRGAGGEGQARGETSSHGSDSKQSPAMGQPLTPNPSPQGGEGRKSGGNFLQIDSSVFMYYTSDDAELPKKLTLDADGNERFKRYLPMDRSFVNTIENYPYPYVIGNLCWEFPCMTPSDWQAQHLQKPNNPKTVEDWKAALDCTVLKQGVMTMVFHPHGWIRNDQLVELIDYAVEKHGKRVKFLTFKEALERLEKGRLGPKHQRILDAGGPKDVKWHAGSKEVDVLGDRNPFHIGSFQSDREVSAMSKGKTIRLPFLLPPGAKLSITDGRGMDYGLRFVDLDADGKLDIIFSNEKEYGIYLFTDMEKAGAARCSTASAASRPRQRPETPCP